ncbi:MAG: hypothetical protein RLZZ15_1996 [Verrucomicrobiota bacterium]|jgi:hypothetical protein
MPPRSEKTLRPARAVHPHAWLWEPLETDPTFVLRPMFGTKAVYLGGQLVLCFCARTEPWRGVLVATDRTRHAALRAEFPALVPHPILPKWLYVPESAATFERVCVRLVALARARDPRLGVTPPPRKKSRAQTRARGDHP